ncbi:MAG: 4a-hydroxytetrahydrobiopterin dehydratase [Crocinitomicaceae bacterium]|nr:4a-hydroxytetrahydrobiopterin dehydratase [Crocinitomicaceae bacterium]
MEIDNWKNTGEALVREFVFKDQTELGEFVLQVAKYSDAVNHHADMRISEWRKLELSITTHDDGNQLTQKDFDWAKGVNELIDL